MNVQVKQLNHDKIFELLLKVDSSFIPEPLSGKCDLKLYSEKLAENATHFVIEEDHKLIGMCCCYLNDPKNEKAFISITCIDPIFFGRGLGKKLTLECESFATKKCFKFIEFEVHIKNIPSIEMHKSLGYFIDRQEKDSFYMKKEFI